MNGINLLYLKKKAKRLYLKAIAFDDLDCGRNIAELLRPSVGIARQEFEKVYAEIRKLDPSAPPSPFEKERHNA